jgi:hypothetical protein
VRDRDHLFITNSGHVHIWFHGVVVSTLDFESSDLGSNPGGTFLLFKFLTIVLILNKLKFTSDLQDCIRTQLSLVICPPFASLLYYTSNENLVPLILFSLPEKFSFYAHLRFVCLT